MNLNPFDPNYFQKNPFTNDMMKYSTSSNFQGRNSEMP